MNCEKKLMEYFYSSILKPGLHKVKQPQAAGDPSLGSKHATSDPSSDMINTLKSFWALRSPKIFTSLFYWTCSAKFLVESLRFWHYQICITNSILQLSKRCIRFRLHTITISIRTAVFTKKLWISWLLFRSPIWKRFSALSDGLISIVQEETLDESWIPVTEKEWREQQDSENEYITKKVWHSS